MELTIITILAVILLFLNWKGPNAVWGGATLGGLIGIIIALFTKDWSRLFSTIAIGIFIGTFFEWIGRIVNKTTTK